MTELTPIERRLAALIAAYAGQAPVRVDPLAMTRIASRRGRIAAPIPVGRLSTRSALMAAALLVLALAAMYGGMLLAGSESRGRLTVATAPLATVPVEAAPTSLLVYAPVSPGPWAPATRVGFVGLPPPGASPSQPLTGVPVLTYAARTTDRSPCCGKYELWLFADGRLIWEEEWEEPFGFNATTTGLLEQRLTPDGVALLRTEALASALFDEPSALPDVAGFIWGAIAVRPAPGSAMATVTWGDDGRSYTVASEDAQRAIRRLSSVLAEPASWLPERAWADRTIRAYVPQRYAICISGTGPDPIESGILPAAALEILGARGEVAPTWEERGSCRILATPDAAAFSAALTAAGARSFLESQKFVTYSFDGEDHARVDVWIDPMLPYGQPRCRCG